MISYIQQILNYLNGQDGIVEISHSIYGNQKIKTQISLINNANKLGVRIGTQEIYLNVDEVNDIQISKKFICINGDLMHIKIMCE